MKKWGTRDNSQNSWEMYTIYWNIEKTKDTLLEYMTHVITDDSCTFACSQICKCHYKRCMYDI